MCYVQDRILQSILILGTADNQNKNTMEAKQEWSILDSTRKALIPF